MRTLFALAALAASPAPTPSPAATPSGPLSTIAEQSGFVQTGRYDEVIRLCSDFALAYPKMVKCGDFGTTPEGRPLLAIVASRDGVLDPAQAREQGRPVALFQGGIHAGEIDGKDAGFLVLKQLLDEKPGSKGDLLSKVTLVFVPVFNVDGHERFGKWNRPNQRGPEQMGWRVTAQNLNLNRDYAKADAPEMAAMLKLLAVWDPIVYVDLHVTDGAKFQHDVSYLVQPLTLGPAPLRDAARELRDGVIARLKKQSHLPIGEFYPSFEKDDDPASGFEIAEAPPRFSEAYWALHDRIGVLVETHSWKDYKTRVMATRDCILDTLELVAARGPAWVAIAKAADEADAKLAGTDVVLTSKPDDHVRTIDFLGYAYQRVPSDVSGGTWTRYDESKPQVWKVPLKDHLVPDLVVAAPRGGYLVEAGEASWMAPKLDLHGIVFTVLRGTVTAPVEAFRATSIDFAKDSYEGHQRVELKGAWAVETRTLAAGALFVPIAQPRTRLAMSLLEPSAPDSLAGWGFFDPFLEKKEYMEPYVAEEIAREMLKDPAVKSAFDAKVAADPDFAKDPAKRLEFFYRRSPSWDERYGLLPVYRVDHAP